MITTLVSSKFWSILLFLAIAYKYVECESEDQKIKLSDVQVLTLYRDQFTTGRRLPGVAQLKCINGFFICGPYAPSAVKCYNKGHDGSDIQWECLADLDKRVRFGYLKVTCEGYDSAKDKYILVGSCGLEYSLELTSRSAKNYNENFHRDLYEASKLSNFLTFLIIIVVILIVYKSCTKYNDNERPDFSNLYGHVNGPESANLHYPSGITSNTFPPPPPPYAYAADPSNAQPHPPGFKPEYMPNTSEGNTHQERNSSTNNQPTTSSSSGANNGNGWGNFLTGVGVGGVTGFLISRRNTSPTRDSNLNRRSGADSPPPAYHDHFTATGLASTSRR